ncbi:hypothetical protein C1M53_07285 [Mesorhizobium sp. Pch-S]|nr:hypothetical protein C1M53_07285 [Mesorhizobium sp. Pch-S]
MLGDSLEFRKIMQKIVYAVIALALIGVGCYRQFVTPSASAADQARCETIVKEIYATSPESIETLAGKCGEPGMVAMMDAKKNSDGAQAAAQAIASANQQDLWSILVNCALIGAGIGAAGAAVAAARKKA